MVGQAVGEQNSVTVLYSIFTWLKKSTAIHPIHVSRNIRWRGGDGGGLLTASHSLRSSPSGRRTACLRFPDPRTAVAYLLSWDVLLPSCTVFFGLNVFRVR